MKFPYGSPPPPPTTTTTTTELLDKCCCYRFVKCLKTSWETWQRSLGQWKDLRMIYWKRSSLKKNWLRYGDLWTAGTFNDWKFYCFSRGGRGGVPPIMTYTGRFYPKGVPFSCRLRVYESVGISLVEVYERVRISVISIGKKAWKGWQMHFMVEKRSGFEIYPYFKDSAFTAVRIKGCKVLN